MDKKDYQLLLDVNMAIASVADKKQLLKTIVEKLQPAFQFYDVGLFVINEEENYHIDWAATMPEISPSEANIHHFENQPDKIPHQESAVGWMLEQLVETNDVQVLNFRDLFEKFPNYPQVPVLKKIGFEESLVAPLRVQGKTLGIFCLNSLNSGNFRTSDFPLFKSISDQLAIVVSNILANEQLLEEKQFKDMLFRITREVAKTYSRPELLKVIFDHVRSIFPFDHAGLFVIDKEKDIFWEILDEGTLDTLQDSAARSNLLGPWPYAGHNPKSWIYIKQPALFDVEEQSKIYPNPQWEAIKAEGLVQMIAGSLTSGSNFNGLLCFLYKEKDFYSEKHFLLFQAIADQLAVAVSNVLANEQLIEEKNFSNTLLQITEAVASVNNTQQLYRTIFDTIKPVFPFNEFGLFTLDDTGDMHYELIDSSAFDQPVSQRLIEEVLGKHTLFPHKGTSVAWLMENGPTAISVEQLDKNAPHPQHQYMVEGGLKSLIGGPLVSGGKIFGMLCFTSTEENFYTEKHTTFFKSIAEQISVAVANILANEQVLEEKQKTENLLKITESIANINTGPELVRAIFDRLQQVFPFNDAGLFHLDLDRQMERDLVVDYCYDIGINAALKEDGLGGWMPITGASKHVIDHKLIVMGADIYEKLDHPHFQNPEIRNFKSVIGAALNHGGQTIGLLYFWSKTEDFFDQSLPQFKSICDQLSVALNNIIANEQLVEEKQFKETLLDISEAVAAIKDRKDLFRTIVENIKPIFPFDDLGVFVYDETRKYQRDLAVDEQFGIFLDYYVEGWLDRDPGIDHFMEHGPLTKSLDSLMEEYPGHPHYKRLKEEGLTQILGGPMKQGGEVVGMLCFWSKQKGFYTEKDFPLFQAISEQLSIAVSNVLANEAIQQSHLEKSVQIALIDSLNKETNWESRQKKFAHVLSQIFPADFIGFHYAKEGMYEISTGFEKTDPGEYRKVTLMDFLNKTNLNLKAFEKVLKEEEGQLPFILEIKEHAESGQYLNPIRKKSLELLGLKSVLAVRMQVDNAPFYIYINSKKSNSYHQKHVEMFKRIAPSFAQSLEKSLASEEVQQREREKVLQIAVINALNGGKTWEDRLLLVARALQNIIPFHLISFGMMGKRMDDINFGFERIGSDEYRSISIPAFLKMTGLNKDAFKHQVQNKLLDDITIGTFKDYLKSVKTDSVKKGIHEAFGVNSFMVAPLTVNNERFYISFYHKEASAYQERHISLLERIQSSFVLSMEKLLGYEEVIRLNRLLKEEKNYLEEEVIQQYNFEEMVGTSAVMQQVFEKVKIVVNTDTTVLILGETGTGKELVARALHNASERKSKPLIKVNCAALPRELIESELFGHEKGAFTGAISQRIGKFELAHQGTLFLDEIGELPLELQPKLLRAIQEKEFERLGGNKTIRIDTRIIAATNRNLEEEVKEGNFRSDLYFRLSIFPIELPPLRERGEDIEALADYFLKKYEHKTGKRLKGITKASANLLNSYPWPGNVRELEQVIERSVLLSESGKPLQLALDRARQTTAKQEHAFMFKTLQEAETELIFETLKRCQGKISGKHGAAEVLGVPPSTLEYRMRRAGITKQMVIGKEA
ncbi:sigma-54-dependent Fis family transcriptional regulator [Tunicatimonas pelagia]|uniref:sigma-54-dependent Fis family transcriptional regulator n=1 Tax=Tunicatimonas pelagia TaxID=931531 RepID=UPI002666870F|nr:sigma 54-interacting transcriptional regulator [Tunicatimonas pelagia]WKN45433.1 sigma 54-interacting transcriptional regulator [Tunicatimonas pelagia]